MWIALLLVWNGDWHQWRGPNATGAVEKSGFPTVFSESGGVAWKTPLPGFGLSTPVVANGTAFLTSAVIVEDQQPLPEVAFLVMGVRLTDGEVVWQREVNKTVPAEGTHKDASWASPSAVTNGSVVVASFGSQGIYTLDLSGQILWSTDLGDMQTRRGFGEGSSPVIANDLVIINWDHEGDSFIAALGLKDGKLRWKKSRDEVTSWSTPLWVNHAGTDQVIVSATGSTRGYRLDDGEVIWSLPGMTLNTIPSPIFADGMVYLMSGFRGNALQAFELKKAQGDMTESLLTWSKDRDTPYVPSAVLHRGLLYYLKHNTAVLTCVDAKNGELAYGPQRVEGLSNVYASLVASDDRVLVVGRDGKIAVLAHGKEMEIKSLNQLDDRFDASPAISGDTLLLRGHKNLYAIAAP
ncbi:MAG: PQQ-binding-like beta-propeller repeat protein [Acidobacteria bacterium]|nr:PQQ-binding-like beta-propeller repeat protein [Acidobacteriota bacterium]